MFRWRHAPVFLTTTMLATSCSAPSAEHSVPAPAIGETPPPAPAADPAPRRQPELELDGITLGAQIDTVLARSPYDTPCELDTLQEHPRQIVLYDPEQCGGAAFPEATLLLLYVRRPPSERTIETIAWIGGTYFDERSSFPLENGTSRARLEATLGPAVHSFPLDGESTVTVLRHRRTVHTFTREGRAVGLVWGPMPNDTRSNAWRLIGAQMNRVTYVGRRRIRSCCAALPSAPPAQSLGWAKATQACLSMRDAFEPIPALARFNAEFHDLSLPAACRPPQ